MSKATNSSFITRPGEARPTRSNAAAARAARVLAHPECVERAVREVEAEAHGLAREPGQIGRAVPTHLPLRAVAADRAAIGAREWRDDLSGFVEHLDGELSVRCGDIHEKVAAVEDNRARRQRAAFRARVQRGEAVS